MIETDRLIIRDYNLEDLDTVHDLIKEPNVYEYMHWGPNSKEDTKTFVSMAIENQNQSPRISYERLIRDKATHQIIGAAGIRVISSTSREGSCGYWVAEDFRGKGIATEATNAIVRFGFLEMNLNKISATVMPKNTGSIRVLEKAGFKKEGVLRDHIYVRDRFYDAIYMSVLKREHEKS